MISAGHISYLGAFTSEFRSDLTTAWAEQLKSLNIAHAEKCRLNDILADPVEVRSWQLCELPTDELSTENGIVMSKSSRYVVFVLMVGCVFIFWGIVCACCSGCLVACLLWLLSLLSLL